MRYIALLRGINVGGYRPLKMKKLRSMFSNMGFKNIGTYIQSGNVVFDGPDSETHLLEEEIADQIQGQFGYEVPVIIRTQTDIEKILLEMPFKETKGWKRYISFFPRDPVKELKEELEERSNSIEQFKAGERLVYSFVDKSAKTKPQFSNNFIERHFGISATTRNVRTVRKLLEMAEE